jgi:dUTP pyrophosphatase
MNVNVIKMYDDVKLPEYATPGAAAFDIYAYNSEYLKNWDTQVYRTGLKFEIPDNHVLMVFSRSGHGFKFDIRLANCVGIIDSDYRGELMIKLTNDNENNGQYIRAGNAIAQGIIMPVPTVSFSVVKDLPPTLRGENGFGSTGN